MKTRQYSTRTLVVLTLFCATVVQADVFPEMAWDGMAQYRVVDLHSPVYTNQAKAGLMEITYLDNSYLAYCGQLSEYAGSGTVLSQTPLIDLPNGGALAYMANTWYNPMASDDDAAALQLAFWEILYEAQGNPWSLGSGDVWVEQTNLATLANNMLADIPAGGAAYTDAFLLEVDQAQDMIVIPEPMTMSLLALGGTALIVRCRKHTT